MVTYWLDKPKMIDPAAIERQFQSLPGLDGLNLPAPGLN